MEYFVEYYHCNLCHQYPISLHVNQNQIVVGGRIKSCPKCGSFDLIFEKVYRADQHGNIID